MDNETTGASVTVENDDILTNAELRASEGSAGDVGMSLQTAYQLRQEELGL